MSVSKESLDRLIRSHGITDKETAEYRVAQDIMKDIKAGKHVPEPIKKIIETCTKEDSEKLVTDPMDNMSITRWLESHEKATKIMIYFEDDGYAVEVRRYKEGQRCSATVAVDKSGNRVWVQDLVEDLKEKVEGSAQALLM